jgi:hypothetical protein
VKAVKNAKTYEVRIAEVAADGTTGPWEHTVTCPNSRAIPLKGLKPGVTYNVQVRAIGGSTGYSGWSDPSSHMSCERGRLGALSISCVYLGLCLLSIYEV